MVARRKKSPPRSCAERDNAAQLKSQCRRVAFNALHSPTRMPRRSHQPTRCFALACAAGLAIAYATPSLAQSSNPPSTASIAPQKMSDDCFRGQRFSLSPQDGTIRVQGAQAWQITERSCTILHVAGTATVRIGSSDFSCERGTLLVMPLPAPVSTDSAAQSTANTSLWQVFALLEDVGSTSSAAASWTGPRLPIRALVRTQTPPVAVADAVSKVAPPPASAAALAIARMQAALAESLAGSPTTSPTDKVRTAPTFAPAPPQADAQQSAPPRRVVAELPRPSPSSQSNATQNTASTPASPPRQAPPNAASNRPSTLTGLRDFSPRAASMSALLAVANPPKPPAAQVQTQTPPAWTGSTSITLQANSLSLLAAESKDGFPTIVAQGPLVLLFRDTRTGKLVQATGQRAVVFLRQSLTAATAELDRSAVEGVYFEGEVSISDGQYTIRSPRIYYDIVHDKATMLDAVFWTYDTARALPLFVRAKEIRQVSREEFVAERATLTNSPFLDPELSLGARSITIKRVDEAQKLAALRAASADRTPQPPRVLPDDPRDRVLLPSAPLTTAEETTSNVLPGGNWEVDARHIVLRACGVPFFAWPSITGDPEVPLIRSVRAENRTGNGPTLKLAWNVPNLLRTPLPAVIRSSTLLTDIYAQRGVGIGTRTTWGSVDPTAPGPKHSGGVFAYALPSDSGDDVFKPGTRLERDSEFRGVFTADHRVDVTDRWSLIGEFAHLSDVAVIDALFEEAAETRREFTSRVVATRNDENSLLSAELKANFNTFLANEWLLQSQGYSVHKLPEASYVRFADDILLREPGELVTFGDYRVGRYRMQFDDALAESRGLSSALLSERALGILPNQSVADRLRAEGYTEDALTRLDARQELIWTRSVGPLRIAPFAVVRATLYDQDFDAFSRNTDGNDSTRIWSALGARASMQFERVIDNVQSDMLDVSRLRHIVEPNITLWAAGTNVQSLDIPQYDPRVDDLADGAAVRLGLAQTVQTKRGGLGTWKDVDLLKINTDFIFASSRSSDARNGSRPIGRFFDSRPEYSALGNYFVGDAAYALTDATSLTATTVFDFDRGRSDISTVGLLLTHAPGFSTLIDLRRLDAQDSTILALWGSYDLTSKYSVAFTPNYNLATSDFESAVIGITRRSSAYAFTFNFSYNDITGETSFGFTLQPYGTGSVAGSRGRFGGFFPGSGGL
jgi:hypothetical protein